MTAGNDFDRAAAELFSALLTPHRSLSRTGFLVLMVFLSVVSFAAGLAFLLMGAWPVFGFFGLDVLVIWWAFRINFRRAQRHRGNPDHAVGAARAPGQPSRPCGRMGAQSAVGAARPEEPRRIRHRTALSGLARPPGLDRELSWGPTKKRVLPKPYWLRCRPPSAARPIIPSLMRGIGNRVVWPPRPSYIRPMMNLAMNEHRLDQTGPPERRAARLRFGAPRHRLHLGALARAADHRSDGGCRRRDAG